MVSGIRELVKAGIAKLPLPPFLSDLHANPKNVYDLSDYSKKNQENNENDE